MQVMRVSRRRFTAFCDLALVSMAMLPSRKPDHMATGWIDPSWLSVHMVIARRSWRKASISSGDMVTRSRCFTPSPIDWGSPDTCTSPIRPSLGRWPARRRVVLGAAYRGGDPGDRAGAPAGQNDLVTVGNRSAPDRPVSLVFVCTGNICRSPMAEVVLRRLAASRMFDDGSALADHLAVSSAGTGGWHEGEPMDPRARAALERPGDAH